MRYHQVENELVPFTPEEEAEWDAQEAAWVAGADNRVATEVRKQRDRLLAECDWVTVKAIDQNAQDSLGIQIPQVWLDYRQALRDVPTQAGFPHTITWPTKPEV